MHQPMASWQDHEGRALEGETGKFNFNDCEGLVFLIKIYLLYFFSEAQGYSTTLVRFIDKQYLDIILHPLICSIY